MAQHYFTATREPSPTIRKKIELFAVHPNATPFSFGFALLSRNLNARDMVGLEPLIRQYVEICNRMSDYSYHTEHAGAMAQAIARIGFFGKIAEPTLEELFQRLADNSNIDTTAINYLVFSYSDYISEKTLATGKMPEVKRASEFLDRALDVLRPHAIPIMADVNANASPAGAYRRILALSRLLGIQKKLNWSGFKK